MKFAKILEALCFLAWLPVALLVNVLLNAWAMSKLWHWFAAVQYGEGPQLGAWFGVAVIARLMLRNENDVQRALKKDDDDAPSLWGIIKKSLWGWAAILFALGTAWGIGSMFHWVQ
jgi:hypothetical protein